MEHFDRVNDAGPITLAFGLALLVAGAWLPMPGITVMALVALGSTSVTLGRFRGTPALLPAMLVHLAVYGSLYALFVGATLHTAATRPAAGFSFLAAADLMASIAIMTVAVGHIWRGLRAALPPQR